MSEIRVSEAAASSGRASSGRASVLTVHVVRHGQTTWNEQGRIQGQTPHVALTALGHQQAEELAERLAARPVGAVFASDLLRAVQTAGPIAARFGVPVRLEPSLRERQLGALEGIVIAEADDDVKAMLDAHGDDPDFVYTRGESYRQLYQRVASFIDQLRADPPASEIVLVTHAGPMRVANAYASDIPVEAMRSTKIGNADIRTLQLRRLGAH